MADLLFDLFNALGLLWCGCALFIALAVMAYRAAT